MPATTVVNIHGKNYTLGVDRDHPAERVQQVADLVDKNMAQVKDELRSGTAPLQIGVLAGARFEDVDQPGRAL